MEQSKKKKIITSILGILVVIIALVGVTYAFFNYTRTGGANTLQVGRIAFISRQTDTVSLSNLFPIDPTETGIMDDATKVGTLEIEVEGDTDYSEGIEYLISSTNTNIYTSTGKTVPISISMTVDSLGTSNANYFTARENTNASIYKRLVGDTITGDQMLLVGFIKPNATPGNASGVDGSITIKAYLDKNKIVVSDTLENGPVEVEGYTNETDDDWVAGRTVLTTAEWNSLQGVGVSFKVRVEANEGIWVNGSLEEIMRKNNIGIDTENGVDFSKTSDQDNTLGVYMRAGTENDAYPIMYYRGAVEDNNVLFANKCWKAVRTTDTGGVKLIYNGELRPLYDYSSGTPLEENEYTITNDDYGFTYDQSEKKFVAIMDDYGLGQFSFTVPSGDGYYAKVEILGTDYDTGDYYYLDYNGSWPKDYVNLYPYEKYWSLGTLTSSDTISFYDYLYDADYGPLTIKIQVLKNASFFGQDCNNTKNDSQIIVNGASQNMFAFNTNYNSPAYVGYMYGTVYTYSNSNWTSNAKFGSSFTWDGTNYKLVDASVTTPNATHHYSCNSTDAEATCTDLRYVYYVNSSTKYYITLTGGDGIEEALTKMQTNTTDSNAKDKIDTWYLANMTSYTNKLEDTVWCNDRSIGRANGWSATGGWGTSDYKQFSLLFGASERSNYASDISTVKNQPSLACTNKNDRFTVNNANGNQALTYPTALLTEDEIVLAGGVAGLTSTFYLYNGYTYYWSLSPVDFSDKDAVEFRVYYGSVDYSGGVGYSNGLRPSVSLKPGTPVVRGSGTVADPYVIE